MAVHHDGTLEDHDMAGASNEPQVSTSTQSDEEFTAQAAAWRSPEDVPNHIPPFLPPLPGFEQPFMPLPPQSAATMPLEPDNQPEAAANNKEEHAPRSTNSGALNMTINATADLQHKHGHVDPWKHVVPFDRSHLQLREPQLLPSNLPLPLKPTDVVNEDEALDSPTHSSLMAYFKLHRHLTTQPPVQPTWPKKSKRRQAAALLNRPEGAWDRFDLSNPSASIGGMVGAQRPRFTRKTPGWLPYPLHKPANPRDRKTAQQPVPILHPYDLQSDMLDPVSSPVIPSDMSDLSANLANLVGGSSARRAAAQDAGLPPGVKGFLRRTTRIAQPGPLGSNGETLPYSLVSGTDGDVAKRVVLGFEWPARDFTASLDGKDKNSQTEDQQAQPTSTQQADETAAIQELAPDQTTSQAQVHGSLASEKQAAAPVAEFTRVDDVMATVSAFPSG